MLGDNFNYGIESHSDSADFFFYEPYHFGGCHTNGQTRYFFVITRFL